MKLFTTKPNELSQMSPLWCLNTTSNVNLHVFPPDASQLPGLFWPIVPIRLNIYDRCLAYKYLFLCRCYDLRWASSSFTMVSLYEHTEHSPCCGGYQVWRARGPEMMLRAPHHWYGVPAWLRPNYSVGGVLARIVRFAYRRWSLRISYDVTLLAKMEFWYGKIQK